MRNLYKYPRLITAVIAVITIFFAFQLPRAQLENNNFRFVPSGDKALKTSQWIDELFGSSFFILIGLERRYETIFEGEFLNLIRGYTKAIEEIPIVRSVTSIINADYITSSSEYGMHDAIVAEKLVKDDFTGTAEEIAELKRRLLSWDMYERALYSDDFTATQILVPLKISSSEASSAETTEQILQIRDLAHAAFDGKAAVYVTGMPIIAASVNEAMNDDLKLLIPLVIVVVLTILFFSFRSFTPVVLPLLTVLVSVIWAIGAMPLFGVKLSVISTVLPVILVAVGSAYGIHVIIHYLNARNTAGEMKREEHTELVVASVMKIRKAVFLTAVTTFVGFLSFAFTRVAPCREFGIFASFGVAAAFAVAITLIPALLIIRGPRLSAGKNRANENTYAKPPARHFSVFLADNLSAAAQRKKLIVLCAAAVVIFSVYGFSKLIIDNVMVEYFKPDTDIYRSDEFIRRQFGGSKVISVVAHADSPELILHPDTLKAMDGLSSFLQNKIPLTGKVMGFTDLIKRINQIFNADESPDGLRVTANANASGDVYGDGASGDDFGFDDFGFDDYSGAAEESSFSAEGSASASSSVSASASGEKIYTQSELLDLLERAAAGFLGMNANDLVWELKKRVNYEGASYYEIPSNPKRYGKETPEELQRLIANYLVLLSGNISDYANDPLEPTAIKSTVQLRTTGMDDSHAIFREMEQYIAANFPPQVEVTLGGTTMVESSLNNLVVQSQVTSMLISIILVFIILSISNKSIIAGLISITPLSISILLNFAVMGFTGIKLNLGTSMVAAVSFAVGIDYTIHCLEAYKREYKAANRTGNFLHRVFFSSGKAIVINAASVGAGFSVLLLSNFVMLADFGLLIAITMFSSALASLTVLPAMLALIKPKFIYKFNE